MTKILLILLTSFVVIAPAQAAKICGGFKFYGPKYYVYGYIDDNYYLPAILGDTKDPKQLVTWMQPNKCYCVHGNVAYSNQYGYFFKRINNLSKCFGKFDDSKENPDLETIAD